jgi:hypothetical protein
MISIKYDKSLEEIAEKCEWNHPIKKFNLFISGGGLKCFYSAGILAQIRHLSKKYNRVEISKIFCTSAGSIGAVCFICSYQEDYITVDSFKELYELIRENYKKGIKIAESARQFLQQYLPENAHLLCSGKVFITIIEITRYGPYKKIISEFSSKNDLIDVVIASCSIPHITINSFYTKCRNMYCVDGVFPIIPIEYKYEETLIINFTNVDYSYYKTVFPVDLCIDKLIVEGIYDAQEFSRTKKSSIIYFKKIGTSKNRYYTYLFYIATILLIYKYRHKILPWLQRETPKLRALWGYIES